MSYRTYANGVADEGAAAQCKSPWEILRATDPDPLIGHDADIRFAWRQETMPRIGADAHLVMAFRDIKRLRQSTGSRAKPAQVVNSSAGFHQTEAAARFQRADQDETGAFAAFHQQVQHPMDAVIHINVNRTGPVSLDERPGARPGEGMGGFVVQTEIRLDLHHDPGTFSPDELSADEFARAN